MNLKRNGRRQELNVRGMRVGTGKINKYKIGNEPDGSITLIPSSLLRGGLICRRYALGVINGLCYLS